jgi:tetratricopeptide (TPR) repeat protein
MSDKNLETAINLHKNNELKKAEKVYLQILERDPKNFNALYLLGTLKSQLCEYEEGINFIKKSLLINDNNFIAYSNLGLCYYNLNLLDEAILFLNKSISQNNNYHESFNNLGSVYLKKKKYLKAFQNYKKTILINNKFYEGYLNIVKLLIEIQKYKCAEKFLNNLLNINPDNFEYYYLKGLIYKRLNDFQTSMKNYLLALQKNPGHFLSYNEIGFLFWLKKDYKNAIINFNKSLSINMDFKGALINRGMTNLLLDKFNEGWNDYYNGRSEFIIKTKTPIWGGEIDTKDKSIFVYAEQGLGDIIQFTRYIFLINNNFKKIYFYIPKSLKYLFSEINKKIELVTDFEKMNICDYYSPLLQLPLIFKTIPKEINYFNINKKLVNHWLKRLPLKKYNIGVCWRAGNKKDILYSEYSKERSFGLDKLNKILEIKDVNLISLQKEPFEDKDNTFYKQLIKFENLDNENPFEDTAAIIDSCELIISCDTSIAHLAGTLGKKTFLMLNYNNDWRWGLDREYCQWYKNIKIYRQVLPNSWDLPFQKCYEDILKNLPKYEKN